MKDIIKSVRSWDNKEIIRLGQKSAILNLDDGLIAVLFTVRDKAKVVHVNVRRIYSDKARAVTVANFNEVKRMAHNARADNFHELKSLVNSFVEELIQ